MRWLRRNKIFKKCSDRFISFCRNSLAEDWVFLAFLGIISAAMGYFMDYVVAKCFIGRMLLFKQAAHVHVALQYFTWIVLPITFLLISFTVVTYVAPQAVGSGIPEMKTILWGIQLKEYLSLKTGMAKIVGLTAALGSGIPLGKEGPLVHIASVIATAISKLPIHAKDFYNHESKSSEMLAAACAVGLAINFAAPVGGVLFSIEVTSSYFPSHNYWRGFVAAIFASLTNRLLAYWLRNEVTLTAAYETSFRDDYPFRPKELIVYLLMGVAGGIAGATFVLIHRNYSLFLKRNKIISSFLKLNRFIYPTVIAVFMASVIFPPALGDYLMAKLTPRQQIIALFANFSWYDENLNPEQTELIAPWKAHYRDNNYFVTLSIYMTVLYFLSIIATTLPVPNGSLVPIFTIGAAFGRMVGEAMHHWFPDEISQGVCAKIIPGGYAIVGAAAFTTGVTHSISIAVVVCEMTGYIGHIIPIMIAVLTSSAVSSLLQPSFFDWLIMLKDLPYLPNINSSRLACKFCVGDFMVRDVRYIWKGMTYSRLRDMIEENPRIKVFPLVDCPQSMILLGSVTRDELTKFWKKQISEEKRCQEVERLHREARINSFNKFMNSTSNLRIRTGRRVSLTLPDHYQMSITLQPGEWNNSKPQFNHGSSLPSPVSYNSRTDAPSRQYEEAKVLENLLDAPPANVAIIMEQSDQNQVNAMNTANNEAPRIDAKCKRSNKRNKCRCVGVLKPKAILRAFKIWMAENEDLDALSNGSTEKPKDSPLIIIKTAQLKPILKPASTLTIGESRSATTVVGVDGDNNETNQLAVDEPRERTASFLIRSRIHLHFQKLLNGNRKPSLDIADMTTEERLRWEETEMSKAIDLSQCQIDPAPFQLVEKTSLIKVHTIFSLLGMKHAYVTALGRLIGVFALREMRKAVDKVKTNLPSNRKRRKTSFKESFNRSVMKMSYRKRNEEKNLFHGKQISSPGLNRRNAEYSQHKPVQLPLADSQSVSSSKHCLTIIITPPSGDGGASD